MTYSKREKSEEAF